MTLAKEYQSLDVESPIDLITVLAQNDEGPHILRFCNNQAVSFGGVPYHARPCTIDWIGKSGEGVEENSQLSLNDTDGVISYLIDNYDDAVIGATVSVKRTLSMFLDGEPTADPTQFNEFKLRINTFSGTAGIGYEFKLIPSVSLERRKLPGRTYLKRCGWKFRDSNCAASTANNFDALGVATTVPLAVCNKNLDFCGMYNNTLRYGGFPGVVRNT